MRGQPQRSMGACCRAARCCDPLAKVCSVSAWPGWRGHLPPAVCCRRLLPCPPGALDGAAPSPHAGGVQLVERLGVHRRQSSLQPRPAAAPLRCRMLSQSLLCLAQL